MDHGPASTLPSSTSKHLSPYKKKIQTQKLPKSRIFSPVHRSSQTREERNPGRVQPRATLYKPLNRKLARFRCISNDPIPRPSSSSSHIRTGPTVQILPIIQSIQRKRPVPLKPPGRVNQLANKRPEKNRPRVQLPGSAQVSFERGKNGD